MTEKPPMYNVSTSLRLPPELHAAITAHADETGAAASVGRVLYGPDRQETTMAAALEAINAK